MIMALHDGSIRTDKKIKGNRESQAFQPLDFFMIRTPLKPLEFFYRILEQSEDDSSLHRLVDTEFVQESIAISSPSLLASITNFQDDCTSRKSKKVQSSVLRYLLRMATRPTPFGFFAGMTTGTFTEKTEVRLTALQQHRKRTRPDMEWLLAVIQKLERRVDVVQQLHVQWNHVVFQNAGKFELSFFTEHGQLRSKSGLKKKTISVSVTPLLQLVREVAATAVLFQHVVDEVRKQYIDSSEQEIISFLLKLFSHEYLISELRPPLTIENPFLYVLGKLQTIDGIDQERSALQAISNLICEYDQLEIGHGLGIFQKLSQKMNDMAPTMTPLQVDVALNTEKRANISTNVAREAAYAAECMWRLSPPVCEFSHLDEYHQRFLERYGTAREVPIQELLHEECGLGVPERYRNPEASEHQQKTEANEKVRHFLLKQLTLANRNKTMEIEITDEFLRQIDKGQLATEEIPESVELYAEVVANSPEAIDQGDFLLVMGPANSSLRAGQSFGRFLDIMSPETVSQIKQLHALEQQNRPHGLFVDASYLPPDGRIANMGIAQTMRQFEIAIGTNPSGSGTTVLPLEDLVVGATSQRLFVKSRSLGREVVVTAENMIHLNFHPPELRFLREVSLQKPRSIRPFQWIGLEDAPFLPRIRYRRTILAPAQWRLTSECIGLADKSSPDKWRAAFRHWLNEWDVPRYIQLSTSDQRILLDLQNDGHVEELRNELNASGRVLLREMVGGIDQRWVCSQEGSFLMECIIPLVRKKSIPIAEKRVDWKVNRVGTREMRLRMPGSDWLHLQLYMGRSREDEFIAYKLHAFADQMVQEGLAAKWFFIRYVENGPHLRLRFQGEPTVLLSKLLPNIHEWAEPLLLAGVLQSLSIHTYEREVERYGGPRMVELAEDLFAADSQCVARQLQLVRTRQTSLPVVAIAALNVLEIVRAFRTNYEEQLSFLDRLVINRTAGQSELRAMRELILPLVELQLREELPICTEGALLAEAFTARTNALQMFSQAVKHEEHMETLWNNPDEILHSLIHMHCNRFMGIDQTLEKTALGIARHALYTMKYWKRDHNDKT